MLKKFITWLKGLFKKREKENPLVVYLRGLIARKKPSPYWIKRIAKSKALDTKLRIMKRIEDHE